MVPIIMPRQGQSVESCIITKWHKKVGDQVTPGEILFSYETDKAAFDEEAKDAGVLLAILRGEGDDVPCLENVAVIGEAGEDPSAFMKNEAAPAKAEEAAAAAEEKKVEAVPAAVTGERAEGKISPRARALAEKSGADLSLAMPTGPHGRVIARDVQKLIDEGKVVTPAARGEAVPGMEGTGLGGRVSLHDLSRPAAAEAAAPAAAEPETWEEKLPNIRKVIARQMHQSLSEIPQVTHTLAFDATQILALRKMCKESGEAFGMNGVTIGDLVVYAVSRTLMQPEHAVLNAHFMGDTIKYFRNVQMGIAVDTPRGLMVPTLRDANKKSLIEISKETKELANACKQGSINPDLLTGASFTVSNVGVYGVESFTPVINPPQTGILGVCALQDRVRPGKDGLPEFYKVMTLSLTYDHRALDGSPASRFLRDLKRNLENIQMLLGGGSYHA